MVGHSSGGHRFRALVLCTVWSGPIRIQIHFENGHDDSWDEVWSDLTRNTMNVEFFPEHCATAVVDRRDHEYNVFLSLYTKTALACDVRFLLIDIKRNNDNRF